MTGRLYTQMKDTSLGRDMLLFCCMHVGLPSSPPHCSTAYSLHVVAILIPDFLGLHLLKNVSQFPYIYSDHIGILRYEISFDLTFIAFVKLKCAIHFNLCNFLNFTYRCLDQMLAFKLNTCGSFDLKIPTNLFFKISSLVKIVI